MTTTTAEPRWTARQVAEFLAMSQAWVYQAAERGILPGYRYGRSLRFDPAQIRAYANAQASKVNHGQRL